MAARLALARRALTALDALPEAVASLGAVGCDVAAVRARIEAGREAVASLDPVREHAKQAWRDQQRLAGADAARASAWVRALRDRLKLLRPQGPAAAEARERVRRALRSKGVRFEGQLDDLRRVVPELRATRGLLGPLPGPVDPAETGAALLGELEARLVGLETAEARSEALGAELHAACEGLEGELRQLRSWWDHARERTDGTIPRSSTWLWG